MELSEIQSVKQRFGIIGLSEALNRAIDTAVQVASTDLSVLVQGESGVGKENFPQIIHQYSHRKHNPYIAVNCGAIPEGTIDSELFGHEKGAFTSATSDRKGYFEEANGGTIFLDEVGELPLSTQVRLLRVLESGEFMRVGSSKVLKTNVRVVAATNVDMQLAINDGKFREDLYYRLNAVPIHVPPLRNRKEDIPLLFRKFASDFATKYKMPIIKLNADAQNMLCNYHWRGNIRQLKNVTEQISVIEQEREIDSTSLQKYLPEQRENNLPTLFNEKGTNNEKSFNNEREILYQVLFDMKKDMAEMKKVVHELMNKEPISNQNYGNETQFVQTNNYSQNGYHQTPYQNNEPHNNEVLNIIHTSAPLTTHQILKTSDAVEDTEEYIEETLSLTSAERDMIIKALEKYKGNRRRAAEELNISQRTLYRRIKEYGLE